MSRIKRKGTTRGFNILLIILSILDLLLLYYTKYRNHGLSLFEFSPSIGNLLNFFFTLLLLSGLILALWRESNLRGVGAFILLMTFFLLSTFVVNMIDLPLPEYYLFNHPFHDIFEASLFCAFQVSEFFAISLVWSKVRDRDNLLYLKAAGNSLFFIILLLGFSYIFISKEVSTPLTKSDSKNVGVVLGAAVWSHDKPSPTLSSRLDKAVELYSRGYLQKVQLTGSNAPGEMTEAEVAFKYIMDKGVVPEDIFFEAKTRSTSEQVKFIKETYSPREDEYNVIIISDKYHLPRIREITRFYNVSAALSDSKLNLSDKDRLYYNLRESLGLIIFWLFAL